MRLLICGGRDYDNQARINEIADAIHEVTPVSLLINGGQVSYDPTDWKRQYGADYQAAEWAKARGIAIRYFMADWNNLGNKAGPLRNERMIREGRPDLVVAMPGGAGTADCVRRARMAGIEIKNVD